MNKDTKEQNQEKEEKITVEEDVSLDIEERQRKLVEDKGYEIVDHSMVLYVKPLKNN